MKMNKIEKEKFDEAVKHTSQFLASIMDVLKIKNEISSTMESDGYKYELKFTKVKNKVIKLKK